MQRTEKTRKRQTISIIISLVMKQISKSILTTFDSITNKVTFYLGNITDAYNFKIHIINV